MKKSFVTLTGVGALLLGIAAPQMAHAQVTGGGDISGISGPFQDVPADHWAYKSVDQLKTDGIVEGYPDKTYGGKRAMTRYEFAQAIARLLDRMNPAAAPGQPAGVDYSGPINDLTARVARNRADIDALQALVNEFKSELQALGQNVAEINKRLDALEGRVAVVEEEQRRLKITGEVSFIGRGDIGTKDVTRVNLTNATAAFANSQTVGGVAAGTNVPVAGINRRFVDQNGTLVGSGSNKYLNSYNGDVYNDVLINLKGKVGDTATANVKIDFTNYLSNLGNVDTAGQGGVNSLFGFLGGGYTAGGGDAFRGAGSGLVAGQNSASQQATTLYEAYIDTPFSLGPLSGADLMVGRFGNQFSKYTLKQVDADVYTRLYQTDNGNIPIDGAKIAFKAGPANLQVYTGKFTAIPYAQPYGGTQYQLQGLALTDALGNPVTTAVANSLQVRPVGTDAYNHAAPLRQASGVRATFGAPEGAVLGLTAETFALGGVLVDPSSKKGYSNLTVFGADFNGALPFIKAAGVTLDASVTNSINGGFRNPAGSDLKKHGEYEIKPGATFGPLSVQAGYQYIGPEFSAPGNWGKIGSWSNPTNVKGFVANAKYVINPKFSIDGAIELYKAAVDTQGSPLRQDDKVNHYKIGTSFALGSQIPLDLAYESTQYDLKNKRGTLLSSGKPMESYYTIGLGYPVTSNASIKAIVQFVDYKDKGTGFGGADNRGIVTTGQFSLKF